jgi:5-methylcytosine-specific restriction endonuclease McrA
MAGKEEEIVAWAKFDDQFTEHPKVVAAGPWAELLAMRGIIYCARYETDGFVPTAAVSRIGIGIPSPKKKAQLLVNVGLWEETDDGWMIHDYLDYQPSKEEKDSQRGVARRRWALNNNPQLRQAIRDRDGNDCRYCGMKVNWSDRKGSRGGTYDHVVPVSQGGSDDLSNIVVSCRDCNLRKGPRSPEQAQMNLLVPSESNLDKPGHPVPVPSRRDISSTDGLRAFNDQRARDEAKSERDAGGSIRSVHAVATWKAAQTDFLAESVRLWSHRDCPTCGGKGHTEEYAPGAGNVKTPCQEVVSE